MYFYYLKTDKLLDTDNEPLNLIWELEAAAFQLDGEWCGDLKITLSIIGLLFLKVNLMTSVIVQVNDR